MKPASEPTKKERFGGFCLSCGEPMFVPGNEMAGAVHERCKSNPKQHTTEEVSHE